MAIAVSGGADSMALLLLASRAAKQHGGNVVALTVDHGLRPEAASEAQQVAQWCAVRGIEHHTLALALPKPSTQETARQARYEALARWCHAQGFGALATGHHRGDQAETLFFRLARGSGLMGLACMQPQANLHGLILLRPLLGASKQALMDFLRQEGQPWIEDASNAVGTYTRNRIRHALAAAANAEALEARAFAVCEAFGRIRAAMERQIDAACRQCTELPDTLLLDALRAQPQGLAVLALGRFISARNGQPFPPRTHQLEQLYRQLCAPTFRRAELGHVAFRLCHGQPARVEMLYSA